MPLSEKVTIIVPCRNEEHYISHVLNHLGMQEGIGDTRIIIADSSTDSTRKVIEESKGNLNVEIIDGGPVSLAKNNGAKLATTPYLLFIDADVRFFSTRQIADAVDLLERKDLHLVGANIKCYDGSIRTSIGFAIFNIINNLMKFWSSFAVGAFMLTRKDIFDSYGGFANKFHTSEDFFLSRNYSPSRFRIKGYFGQDSRRFRKMGYTGMSWYLIKNFLNRNNKEYWTSMDCSKYWD